MEHLIRLWEKKQSCNHLPGIDFYPKTGILKMYGNSLQGSDPIYLDVYESIFNWIEEYCKSPTAEIQLHICFHNLCIATSTNLLHIMQILERFYKTGHPVSVKWYYTFDDEDRYEDGENYKDILDLPFSLIEADENMDIPPG